jgi:tetratricopeptide (TPR) repeat protein
MARVLRHIPIRRYQLIGKYYEAWLRCRRRDYSVTALERVIDQTDDFKARGLMLRAAIEGYQGNLDSEMYFYKEARAASQTISEYLDSSKAIAVVKAKEGSHAAALNDLEALLPYLRYADPLVYFDTLNSYAVELAEVGRVEQARQIATRVVATPFAFAHPAWLETAEELRGAERCTVTVSGPVAHVAKVAPPAAQPQPTFTGNVVALLPRARVLASLDQSASTHAQPARIITYRPRLVAEQIEIAPPDAREGRLEPTSFAAAELAELSIHDKQKALLTVIFDDEVTHETLNRLLVCAGCVETDTPAS